MEVFTVILYLIKALPLLAAAFLCVLVIYIQQQHQKFAHVPGPPRDSFIFGNLPTIKKYRKEKGYFLARLFEQWTRQYGNTFVVFFLFRPVVFTVEPNAIKELLTSGHHVKPDGTPERLGFLFGVRFIGRGLITETNEKRWAKRRLVLNHAFYRSFLRSVMDKFNEVGDHLVEKLEQFADGKTVVNLADVLHCAALDVIGKVAFGKDLKTLEDTSNKFPDAIYTTLKGLSLKMKDPFLSMKFWKEKEFKEKVRKACYLLRESGNDWIKDREEAIRRGEAVPDDILTLMIHAQESDPEVMTDEERLDDIVTFFLAGQETTANSLTFLLYSLIQEPEVLAKLQQEIEEVQGGSTHVEFDNLHKLEYMAMVLKETLRLYCPVTLIFRQLGRDVVLDGYSMPKGTNVALSQFVAGRCPTLHPDPDKFMPERFHSDFEQRASVYSYFPFALGPRNCIGQNFANVESKVFLVKLLQKFDFKLVPDYEMKLSENMTLQPVGGIPCTLTLKK